MERVLPFFRGSDAPYIPVRVFASAMEEDVAVTQEANLDLGPSRR